MIVSYRTMRAMALVCGGSKMETGPGTFVARRASLIQNAFYQNTDRTSMEEAMNGKWTTVLAGGVIAVLILAAGALGALFARPGAVQAAQMGGSYVRQITVVGTGEARGTPNQATVQLGVQTEAAVARDALAENTTKMNALIAKLKELGVAAKDIQTSNFNISPMIGENGRTVTAYQVSNNVSVVIRDVAKAGDLLDDVVAAGANTVYGISFSIDNPQALQAQARDAAIADARTRAQAMAQAAGGSVGQVLSISETIGAAPQPLMYRAEMAQDSAAPIEAGEQALSAQVQITFELK